MPIGKTLAVAAAVLVSVTFAAGCASRYDRHDDAYGYSQRDHRGEQWRGRHDRDEWRGDTKKVRVCDADGSDCHWEYRER